MRPGASAVGPVVLLASLGRPADALVGSLSESGREGHALDLPGVAGVPGSAPGGDLHDLAASVAGRIAPLGSPAHLVDHAFGNRLARCVAADHPELVCSLTVLGCGGKFPGDPEARRSLSRCFTEEAGTPGHRAAVSTVFFAPTSAVPASWEVGWWPEAAESQRAALERTQVTDWWVPPTPLPVLALVGAEDRISPPPNARDLVDRVGDRGRLEIVPRAGHALLPEQPERVAAVVLDFLASVDP